MLRVTADASRPLKSAPPNARNSSQAKKKGPECAGPRSIYLSGKTTWVPYRVPPLSTSVIRSPPARPAVVRPTGAIIGALKAFAAARIGRHFWKPLKRPCADSTPATGGRGEQLLRVRQQSVHQS